MILPSPCLILPNVSFWINLTGTGKKPEKCRISLLCVEQRMLMHLSVSQINGKRLLEPGVAKLLELIRLPSTITFIH